MIHPYESHSAPQSPTAAGSGWGRWLRAIDHLAVLGLLITLVLFAYTQAHADGAGHLAGALSGHWTDRSHPGEGFTVEILEDQRGVAFWLTYDHEGNQAWILGVGDLVGDQLIIEDAIITAGGRFGLVQPREVIDRTVWGRMTFTFIDCLHAQFEYQGPPEYGSGTQQLTRLSVIDGRECNDQRQFRMGFTPFPPDVAEPDLSPLIETYTRIREHGDIIGHHLDDGIPWPEAAAGGGFESYPAGLQAEWNFRRTMTPAGHQVYLAITPIAALRDELAPYRGDEPNIPRSVLGPPWDTIRFNDPLVKGAFAQHAINAVEFFRPDWLAIGIEVNLLAKLSPAQWADYLELHTETYTTLKARYPSLPVFVTIAVHDLLPELTDDDPTIQMQALAGILPLSDLLGISFYPHLSRLGTAPVPATVFRSIDALTDKPIAVTETGFPAEARQLNIPVPGGTVSMFIDGSPEKQRAYFEQLMDAADRHQFRFVINFFTADFDALCDALQCTDFARIWQDTGFWDENGHAREVLELWDQHRSRPLRQ